MKKISNPNFFQGFPPEHQDEILNFEIWRDIAARKSMQPEDLT